jgi:hypothetical protein
MINKIDIPCLSRLGFELIRYLIRENRHAVALDLAEALHNMPDNNDDYYRTKLTIEKVNNFTKKYPEMEYLNSHVKNIHNKQLNQYLNEKN